MPDKNDLADDQSEDSGSEESSSSKSNKSEVNYEQKYKGMQKRFDAERQAKTQLQEKLDEMAAKHEEDLSNLRIAEANKTKRVKELEDLYNAEKSQREELDSKVKRHETRQQTRLSLKDSHPALLDLYDAEDLKELQDFGGDEAKYKEYLDRMSRFVSVPEPDDKQRRNAGATPPTGGGRVRDEGKGKKTLEQLTDELSALDPRDPQKGKKQAEILAQMDRL